MRISKTVGWLATVAVLTAGFVGGTQSAPKKLSMCTTAQVHDNLGNADAQRCLDQAERDIKAGRNPRILVCYNGRMMCCSQQGPETFSCGKEWPMSRSNVTDRDASGGGVLDPGTKKSIKPPVGRAGEATRN